MNVCVLLCVYTCVFVLGVWSICMTPGRKDFFYVICKDSTKILITLLHLFHI